MNKQDCKKFRELYQQEFGNGKIDCKIDCVKLLIFLQDLDLEFEILDLSDNQGNYWYEVRTGFEHNDNNYYSVVFNHDFRFLLDEYDCDDVLELIDDLELQAEKVRMLFINN